MVKAVGHIEDYSRWAHEKEHGFQDTEWRVSRAPWWTKCGAEKREIMAPSKGSVQATVRMQSSPPLTGKAIKGEADLVNKGQELLGCVHLKCLCQVSRTLGKVWAGYVSLTVSSLSEVFKVIGLRDGEVTGAGGWHWKQKTVPKQSVI